MMSSPTNMSTMLLYLSLYFAFFWIPFDLYINYCTFDGVSFFYTPFIKSYEHNIVQKYIPQIDKEGSPVQFIRTLDYYHPLKQFILFRSLINVSPDIMSTLLHSSIVSTPRINLCLVSKTFMLKWQGNGPSALINAGSLKAAWNGAWRHEPQKKRAIQAIL